MFNLDRWREIFESIRSNVLRTVLSGFTVALGLFIFIVLFGIGNGLQNSFSKNFFGSAANAISIFGGITSKPYAGMQSNRTITLDNSDYKEVIGRNKGKIELKAPTYDSSMPVQYEDENGTYTVTGSSADQQKISDRGLVAGRYINPTDIQRDQKVAVIGRLVQKDLIRDGNPIGKTININGSNFTVVGVYSDPGGDWQEKQITVPISTLQQMKKSSDTLSSIRLTYDKDLSTNAAVALGKNIEKQLKTIHRVDPMDDQGIVVRNNAESMKSTVMFMLVLTVIVGVIGMGTLIAGILGISNIMVYIVKERTKEIGVRKAIGAHPSSIVGLIMQESIVITVISGVVGIALGVLTLKMIGGSLEKYFITNPGVGSGIIVFAFFCLIFAGAIAGFVPAYRASRIRPIEALRTE